MDIKQFELKPSELSGSCDPLELGFSTTAELNPLEEVVGQARGMRAVEFGIEIDAEGYSAFVLGPKGSGRTSAVQSRICGAARKRLVPPDWCYVNNFRDPDKPIAISLPPGKGREFRDDVSVLVNELARQFQQLFESESYQRRHDEITETLQEEQNSQFQRLQEKAKEAGFALQRAGNLFGIVPMKEGKALDREEFAALGDEEKAKIEQKGKQIREELNEAMKNARQAEKKAH